MRVSPLILMLTGALSGAAAPLPDPDSALAAEVDRYLGAYAARNDFAGAVLIARDGKIVLRRAYGLANHELNIPNTPGTRFHVASLSKPFTATLILRLEQQGLLRVEDPVSKYVPDYPRGSEITLHHVLTHRAGIPSYNRFPDYDAMMQKRLTLIETVGWFKNQPLRFEPGARYEYSNSGYTLLAHVIEIATGKSFETVLHEQITGPLGMTGTGNFTEEEFVDQRAAGYEPGEGMNGLRNARQYDRSAKRGSGALWSTVDDLYTFDQALYGEQILSNASKAKAFARQDGGSYGYGWGVAERFGTLELSHNGKAPGYIAQVIRYPAERITIIFAGNIYSGAMNVFARDLPAIVFGQRPAAPLPQAAAQAPDPAALDRFAGRYRFPLASGLEFDIARRGAHLYIRFGVGAWQYLTPETENQFILRSRYDRLTFLTNPEGKVHAVTYNELGFGAVNTVARVDVR